MDIRFKEDSPWFLLARGQLSYNRFTSWPAGNQLGETSLSHGGPTEKAERDQARGLIAAPVAVVCTPALIKTFD